MNLFNSLKLYAVTDSRFCINRSLEEITEEAILGGVTMVQLREKYLGYDEFLNKAISLKSLCDRYNVPLIINDNIEVALMSKACGLHIGQGDRSIVEARKILGNKVIIGVSAHCVEEAVEAERLGADYLGVGAVFSTSTKVDAVDVNINKLIDIIKSVDIPVVAIGGITSENLLFLKGSGIAGAAIISGIFGKDNIKEECRLLRAKLDEVVNIK
ncbi:MAG: thiamine phosphate synthase [Clostridium sp.]|uniref:thiamine phosphate synthase n=1 Tax=Clostridium sp. TaxID=1506 RepID=UPI002FCC2809